MATNTLNGEAPIPSGLSALTYEGNLGDLKAGLQVPTPPMAPLKIEQPSQDDASGGGDLSTAPDKGRNFAERGSGRVEQRA